ncbi:LOW QUALITY PROTEIN: transmembrane protein 203 [Chelonoidis abingdonii]|uniref:LOW QUALITY PROTEIN: transmembrane protein 203 n=1 Tax=Chelonoidis abingdonii TaxID=106734 RepID=UPI0013F23A57|nr:LOW QUALITY PROTEIN: transmembrane protein 203 [Chelonoidis abingdonii]
MAGKQVRGYPNLDKGMWFHQLECVSKSRCCVSALRELVHRWLGPRHFECLPHLLALLLFSVLLVLKVDGGGAELSWWKVFIPFFAADGLSTYFTTIVSVRLFQDGEKRLAVLRLFWILTILSLKFVFEMLLCQKLVEQTRELWYGLIMSPIFILLQLLMIRACRVN